MVKESENIIRDNIGSEYVYYAIINTMLIFLRRSHKLKNVFVIYLIRFKRKTRVIERRKQKINLNNLKLL